ncbi:MAG: TlpA family protein disulfide reductase [Deltaproteobacteria bacterium]|nr:TlpA family protein disulfide reductase [Deltaproteobacteria bacterium]
MRNFAVAGSFLGLLVLAQLSAAGQDPPTNFALKNLKGELVRLSDFRGSVVLLNFWATWCVPCKEEIPHLVELDHEYRGKGLRVVGVSFDARLDKVPPFVAQMKMEYPILMGTPKLAEEWGIRGIPMSFLLNREGKVCRLYAGPRSKAAFEQDIRAILFNTATC